MRETGRHRGEPSRLVPFLIIWGTIGLVALAIVIAFLLQPSSPQQPAPATYVPSSHPVHGPAVAPSASISAVPAPVRAYPAGNGDSLWSIALRQCGNSNDWRHLASTNHISWPWTVKLGQVITLDCAR